MAVSESQKRARKNYESKNPEKTKKTRYGSVARTFVRHYATKEDIEELVNIFKKENKNSK